MKMKSIIVCIVCLALSLVIHCKEINRCGPGTKNPNCGHTVEVGVYVEALCPYSRIFVNQQLFPTFTKLNNATPPIMTINMVPFGNAKMVFVKNATRNPSLNFTCQHKDQECEGNILQSCAVMKFGIEKSLPYVNCMFNSSNWKTPWIAAQECSQKLKIDFNTISECAKSLEGVAIEYFMAGQTLALVPTHTYVPWITINGQHTQQINDQATSNLLKLVCDSYQMSPKPAPCSSV